MPHRSNSLDWADVHSQPVNLLTPSGSEDCQLRCADRACFNLLRLKRVQMPERQQTLGRCISVALSVAIWHHPPEPYKFDTPEVALGNRHWLLLRLMNELSQVVNRIKSMQSAQVVHRSHQRAARCSECIARSMCFEALS
jgi:hypothetical protein